MIRLKIDDVLFWLDEWTVEMKNPRTILGRIAATARQDWEPGDKTGMGLLLVNDAEIPVSWQLQYIYYDKANVFDPTVPPIVMATKVEMVLRQETTGGADAIQD